MEITANELYHILNVSKSNKKSVKDCKNILYIVSEKAKGKKDFLESHEKEDNKLFQLDSFDVDLVSDYLNIDLRHTIKDIKENYLKRPQTRGFIFNYPSKKIKEAVGPTSIHLPGFIKTFLSKKDQILILNEWENRFSQYKNVKFKL